MAVLWAALALGSAAAQESADPAEQSEQETPVKAAERGGEDSTDSAATADEVFVPSERISADQEVIFPVDI